MATKLSTESAKRLKALEITAKTEEEAREKLLKDLAEKDVEGMEDEDLGTLLDIAESFVDEAPEASEDEEANDLAEETEEEEEEEEEGEEGDDFDHMDREELKAFIKENGLEITVKKSMSDDDIRNAIRENVEGEEEEEEAPKAPAKKEEPKKAEKKAEPKKEEPKKGAAKKEEPKKAEKKEKVEKAKTRGTKLDPKNVEEDREHFEPLRSLFPEEEFEFAWVASAGVTVKHIGKNSRRAMVLIENCSVQADESIKCNLYLLTFTKNTEPLEKAGIEFEPCWSGAPLVKGITFDEAMEIILSMIDHILATVQKIDKKLGENRKKMEENLNKKAAPAKKEEPKKAAAPVKKEEPKKAATPAKKVEATKKTTKK